MNAKCICLLYINMTGDIFIIYVLLYIIILWRHIYVQYELRGHNEKDAHVRLHL